MNTNDHKKTALRRAVLIGLALSATVWTTGMAETIEIDKDYGDEYNKPGETITISGGDDTAIKQTTSQEGSLVITSQGNTISSDDNVAIQINGRPADDNDYTLKLDATTGKNMVTSDANDGISSNNGNTEMILTGAENEITAAKDGIAVSGSGKGSNITLVANGEVGNKITAGQDGLTVSGGNAVSLQSDKGINQILAGTSGATVSGKGSAVTLRGQKNEIIVDDSDVKSPIGTNGIHVTDGAEYVIDKTDGATTTIDVTGHSSDVYGVWAENEGTVNVTTGDFTATAKHQATSTATGGADVYGIRNTQSTVEITASGSVNIDAKNEATTSFNNSIGLFVATGNTKSGGPELETSFKDATVNIEGADIKIKSSVKENGLYPGAVGLQVDNGVGDYYRDNDSKADVTLHATGKNGITITSTSDGSSVGVMLTQVNSEVNLIDDQGDVTIAANGGSATSNDGVYVNSFSLLNSAYDLGMKANISGVNNTVIATGTGIGLRAEYGKSSIGLMANGGNNTVTGANFGIYASYGAQISLLAEKGKNIIGGLAGIRSAYGGKTTIIGDYNRVTADGASSSGLYSLDDNSNISLKGTSGNFISVTGSSAYSIRASGANSIVEVASSKGNNTVESKNGGILVQSAGSATLTADVGSNAVTADNNYALFASGEGTLIDMDAGKDNQVSGKTYGIAASAGTADLDANGSNIIASEGMALYGYSEADISLTATNGNNVTSAGTRDEQGFGSGIAVKALSGADVTFKADNGWNAYLGAIDTRNENTEVDMAGAVNAVYSAAVIDNAGGLQDDKDPNKETSFVGKSVISALYAEGDAKITSTGDWNIFQTKADPTNEDQLERVVWAYDGADIEINGSTYISTDQYDKSPNSADIAIAAGTAVNLTDEMVNAPVEDRAKVTLKYGAGSEITGDILAAYAGTVNINATDGTSGINVTGNIIAGNNGILNLDLGRGGVLTGRADDYGDAGLNTEGETIDEGHAGSKFFNPAFSSTIYKGGEVNLTMGEGSRWDVTGQSWVTRLNTEAAPKANSVFDAENPVEALGHMATIDLTHARTEELNGGHALTVYDMKGDAAFNMKLDAVRGNSDMLYMKHAKGDYIINVVDAVTMDDMYADGFEGLRFATVGKGSDVSFRAVTVGEGVFNVEYEVGTDDYAGNKENVAYNGDNLTASKPGDTMVDNFFESTGEPGAVAATQAVQTLALTAENAADKAGDETDAEDSTGLSGTTNFKLVGRADEQTSNAGKTVIAMSKVNYSNAVYMDRLNKRMGEARYLTGDDGLWVRMRHDRIGKDDAFRSMNTMFEIGYDWKDEGQKDGTHYRGFAFDYMRGTADYQNVAGDGDVRRAGLWYHDTWLGDAGHYTDYVVKYGRLSNDFDIYSELGEKISGDYDNDVWSVSAEYGRKKDLGNDWYFEPQAQLQYAYVTDASYTTSQGTKVDLDAIDSLIGRAGFRIGRDTSAGDTVYFKADILHEFLGDQDIRARDTTGVLSETYENEGTWYDVGFGFSHRMNDDSYVFLDLEHSFGNDNEDTYQVNIGLSKAF